MMIEIPWTPDKLQALAAGSSAFGPLASIDEMMRGAILYHYDRAGESVLVAARPVHLAQGVRLDLVGLRSLGNRLAGRPFHTALDALALQHSADYLALCTNVPHVAKSCTKNGYAITGAVLTKKTGLQNGQ